MFAISVLGVLSLGAFLYVETKVADPILPLSLFANRAFAIAAAIGFIVGMALFGSITLLPVYLQVVKGLDPTSAGLHMTPMMLGVFASSITSGQIISRIGRYKIFPIIGTGLMTIALFLLSRITLETPASTASVYMLLLGLGLGMVMQILVMAVQNAVAYEQLGVATSGTTLFRSIGGAVGAALFGGIFNYTLRGQNQRDATRSRRQVDRSSRDRDTERAAALYLFGTLRRVAPSRVSHGCVARLCGVPVVICDRGSAAPDEHRTEADERSVSDAARCNVPRRTRTYCRARDGPGKPLARLSALRGALEYSTRARRILAVGANWRARRSGGKGGPRQTTGWRSASFANFGTARVGRYGAQDIRRQHSS